MKSCKTVLKNVSFFLQVNTHFSYKEMYASMYITALLRYELIVDVALSQYSSHFVKWIVNSNV